MGIADAYQRTQPGQQYAEITAPKMIGLTARTEIRGIPDIVVEIALRFGCSVDEWLILSPRYIATVLKGAACSWSP